MEKKRRIRKSRVLLAFLFFCGFIGLVFGIMLLTAAKPPVYAITQCQYEISRAREVEADRYAPHALVSDWHWVMA